MNRSSQLTPVGDAHLPIAIVGLGCRFPGGVTCPESFWRLLSDGIDAVTEIPADRWDRQAFFSRDRQRPGKMNTRWGGFLDGIDRFDAAFFGISPREASRMDPQQRLLLEVAWEALEDGGQPLEKLAGQPVGVFMGVSCHDYYELQTRSPEDRWSIDTHTSTGSAISLIANRISHALDLRGPSIAIDTACSSSLVSMHLACQSLRQNECGVALAGGVNVMILPDFAICLSQLAMLSPDGRCKAFDAGANGYVRGEGAGVAVLKPLAAAEADGDPIYAVICGSAVNQDGRTKGITVPRVAAQEDVIRRACQAAGIAPSAVSYVEAHGTGTPVGDPIEATALSHIYSADRPAGEPCLIGSVKTNIGHLESAAGVAGLIKVALALKHGSIPASLHHHKPPTELPLAELGLEVVTEHCPWPTADRQLLAGVNSFGFGGTNAHLILAPPPGPSVPATARAGSAQRVPPLEPLLVPLSARSPEALRQLASSLVDAACGSESWQDLVYSTIRRRSHLSHRLAVVADSSDTFRASLETFLDQTADDPIGAPRDAPRGSAAVQIGESRPNDPPRPVFVFCGQGPQWWAMGRQLLAEEPLFRRKIQQCDALVRRHASWSLLDELNAGEGDSRLDRTEILQPTIFAIQVALAALWRSWGLEPAAVIGHSMGEIAAAHVAGALDLGAAVEVIVHRARLQQRAADGGMMAVGLSQASVQAYIDQAPDALWIAGINSPSSVTVAGTCQQLDALAEQLAADDIFFRRLRVECACHSPHMDPFRAELLDCLAELEPQRTRLPMFSTVTGAQLVDASWAGEYWWQNFRRPVQFERAVAASLAAGFDTFIELGPHPVLAAALTEISLSPASLSEQRPNGKKKMILASLRRGEAERATLLSTLGALYCSGLQVDWQALTPPGSFVPLPLYPWQRESHWHESARSRMDRLGEGHALLGGRLVAPEPTWQRSLDLEQQTYLADHRIQGSVVVPGVIYVLMALAAGRQQQHGSQVLVEEVQFHKALFLPADQTIAMRLRISPDRSAFDIHSLPLSTPNAPASASASDSTSRPDSRLASGNHSEAWSHHASGYLRRNEAATEQTTGQTIVDLATLRARCLKRLDADVFYRNAAARGIELGTRFRGIDQLWRGDQEVLAKVRILPVKEDRTEQFDGFHPATLDACFQSALALLDEQRPGLYLPVRIEQLRLHGSPTDELWSFCRLVEDSPRALYLDLQLLDGSGRVLAEVRRLRFIAVGDSANSHHPELDRWLCKPTWELEAADGAASPLPSPLPAPSQIAPRLQASAAELYQRLDRGQFYAVVDPAITAVCHAFLQQALDQLGWSKEVLDEGQDLADRLAIAPAHRRLFRRLLHYHSSHPEVADSQAGDSQAGDSPAVVQAAVDPTEAWSRAARRFPEYHAELWLLQRCGSRLAQVLRGEVDPLQVLFAEGSQATLGQLYQDAPISRFYNRLARSAVRELIAGSAVGHRLRCLEIGAGTGALTAHMLTVIPPDRIDTYVFTDISALFTTQAERLCSTHSFLRTARLDIEQDPESQGFEAGTFDLVLASDVLHATRDLTESIGHIRNLLRPGGVLVMLEATRRTLWADLIFGLTEGWWRFTDSAARPEHPLAAHDTWLELLNANGFDDAVALPEPEIDSRTSVRHLFLARAKASPTESESVRQLEVPQPEMQPEVQPEVPGTWLLLADDLGLGADLGERLRACGEQVVEVSLGESWRVVDEHHFALAANSADFERLLSEVSAQPRPALRGIVHLWSLDGVPPTHAEDLASLDSIGALAALWLVQAVASCQTPGFDSLDDLTIVLATCGAQAVPGADDVAFAQAPLIGLGRVLVHEHPKTRCRMVDLTPGAPLADGAALFAELWRSDHEEEVALRHGRRWVQRLTPVESRSPAHDNGSPQPFRLQIETPGLLDHLVLRASRRQPLAALEVEIEVAAAGLNFKDLMIALGMLSDEALERSYGGPLLGTECAGRIRAVGDAVDGLNVGDEVIAIAPCCFAPYATTIASFVVAKPACLSFEAATTLPIVFVTAHYALTHLARAKRGESVLIHSASGGVGLAALQLARHAGLQVFATAGSTEKRAYLRALGVEHVMDSRSIAFADQINELTGGRGVDIVLNSLTGDAIAKNLAILAPLGRFIEIGKADIYQDNPVGLWPFRKNLSFFAVDLSRICLESPEAISALLHEVVALAATSEIWPLPHRVFGIDNVSNAFRFMAKAQHVGKIVIDLASGGARVVQRPRATFDGDKCFLITGGLGGFGLEVALWMVARGVRHLVLAGRSGAGSGAGSSEANPAAQAALAALTEAGAEVIVCAVDVSQQGDVARLLSEIDATGLPLGGIVHAAMVLDDALLVHLGHDSWQRVIGPKILGAWHLDRMTRDRPLDHFILFSSIATLLGSAGQANYVAANAFLDALAHSRQHQGLPALSVNWGRLGEVGYVARNSRIEPLLDRQGVLPFSPRQALELLDRLLALGLPQAGAARMDWQRWGTANPAGARSPRLARLRQITTAESDSSSPDRATALRNSLATTEPAARLMLIEDRLRELVAKVLGALAERLDSQQPLTELGLDSLMAVELKNRLEKSLAVDLPVMKLLQGPSLQQLAHWVLDEFHQQGLDKEPTEEATAKPTEEATAKTTAAITAAPADQRHGAPGAPNESPEAQPEESPQESPNESPRDVPAGRVDTDRSSQVLPRPTAAVSPVPEPAQSSEPNHYEVLDYSRLTPFQRTARAMMRLILAPWLRVELQGMEKILPQGPLIVAGNHVDLLELAVFISRAHRRCVVLTDSSWQEKWVGRWFLDRTVDAIYIHRGAGDTKALEQALGVLRGGGVLVMSPEGNLSPTLQRGHVGVAYLATRAAVPVLPIAMSGHQRAESNWRRLLRLRRLPIRVEIGDLLHLPTGDACHQDLQLYTDEIMAGIASMLPPEYRGVYRD